VTLFCLCLTNSPHPHAPCAVWVVANVSSEHRQCIRHLGAYIRVFGQVTLIKVPAMHAHGTEGFVKRTGTVLSLHNYERYRSCYHAQARFAPMRKAHSMLPVAVSATHGHQQTPP